MSTGCQTCLFTSSLVFNNVRFCLQMSELRNRCSIWKSKSEDVEVWGCFFSSLILCCHTGNIQEVILQERIEKEDEVLVSLAGLKQVGLLLFYTRYCCVVNNFLVLSSSVRSKTFLKGRSASIKASWRLRRMKRSPSPTITTLPPPLPPRRF